MAKISGALLVIGGLNWGLVGLGMLLGKMDAWNIVNAILGSMPTFEAIVYLLVGIIAVMAIFGGCRCHKCKDGACAPSDHNEVNSEARPEENTEANTETRI